MFDPMSEAPAPPTPAAPTRPATPQTLDDARRAAEAVRARIRYDIDHQHTTEMPDYLGEAWCRGISCGAELIEISANRMVVRLEDARAGQDLVLNQNW